MRVTTSKSKNSESFYITKGFINEKGVSTSSVVRKLGTLNDLLKDHGPTRDDVMAWAREQAMLETEKYKKENEARTVLIPFHADRQLDYGRQRLYKGGYLFLQSVYYGPGYWNLEASVPLTGRQWTISKGLPMKSMMSTAPWTSLLKNVTSYRQKPSRTAAS